MIKASYHSNLQADKTISFQTETDGFLLINGRQARSFFDIIALKGFNTYSGSFIVNGNDLLDVTNANRDRSPVSVIACGTLTFQVSRSQVPLGVVAKTDKIDAATKRFIDEKNIPHDWQLNFTHLFQAVYAELCAHPFYVVLDLSRAEKVFVTYVVDLIDKVLGKYRIYAYAPQLFSFPSEDITIYNDIKEVLNPKANDQKPLNHEQAARTQAILSFMDDLSGVTRTPPPAPEKPRVLDRTKIDENVHSEPAPNSYIPTSVTSSPSEEKPDSGIFRFDPKKTDMYNFVFASIFVLLAIVISFLFFTFSGSSTNIFFGICFVMALVFSIMSIIPIRTINKDNSGKRIRDSRYLFLSTVLFPLSYLVAAGAMIGVGMSLAWNPLFFWLFGSLFIVFALILSLYVYFTNKVFLREDKDGK